MTGRSTLISAQKQNLPNIFLPTCPMEDLLALIVIGLQVLFMITKIYLTTKHSTGDGNTNKYPLSIGIFQGVHGLVLLLPFIWYLDLLDFLNFSLPSWLRWLAVGIFIVLIGIMIWQMRILSVNISAVHENRFLVTTGPYGYVRHPLYLLFVLMPLDMWLITANWIFLIAVIPAAIGSKIRADYEEKVLLEEYGQNYRDYQANTGQFIPKFS